MKLARSFVATACVAAAVSLALAAQVESWPLDAGTEVALVEDHRAPFVSLRVEFPVGTWSPWFRHAHAAEAFEIQMYDPASALRRRADAIGAGISFDAGDRYSTVSASCLKDDLPQLLQLIRDTLANREFDRKELRRWAQAQTLEWDGSQKEPEFRAAQAIARMLYQKEDPRRREYEKPDSMETSQDRLVRARDAVVRIPGRIVTFAGDLSRAEATAAATGLLPETVAEPPGELKAALGPVTSESARPRELDVRLPRLTQVYFTSVRDMIPVTDPDYPAYFIANHVLGGYFYSRLYRALRHEGGDTYGAGSGGPADPVAQDYALYTFTRAGNAADAEGKLRETLRVFHDQGITEAERADAVSYLLGHRPFLRETPAQIMSRFLYERRFGLPAGFLDDVIDRASKLPVAEINRFIERFHDPAKFTMVRVEPQ